MTPSKKKVKKKKSESLEPIDDIDRLVDDLVRDVAGDEDLAEEELYSWIEKENKRLGIPPRKKKVQTETLDSDLKEKSIISSQSLVQKSRKPKTHKVKTVTSSRPKKSIDPQKKEISPPKTKVKKVRSVTPKKKITTPPTKKKTNSPLTRLKEKKVMKEDRYSVDLQNIILKDLRSRMIFMKDFQKDLGRKYNVKPNDVQKALEALTKKGYIEAGKWDSRRGGFTEVLPYLKEDVLYKITSKGKKAK